MDNVEILIVEDEESHVEAIRRSLGTSEKRYNIRTVSTVREFHSETEKYVPHMVIADLNLPDGEAFDILSGECDNLPWPVIVMTACGDEEMAVRAIKAGALDYIVKSADTFSEMAKTIDRTLREWQNIQKRKLAEEELRESEKRQKTIIDSIQAGILLIDGENHIIIDANPGAISMLGSSSEEIIGSVCHKYICPEEKGNCPITDLKQKVNNSERILLTGKGRRSVLKTVAPVMIQGREYLLESFIDITERKAAEEALGKSEERYRLLAENASDTIWMMNLDGTFTYHSPAVMRLRGYTPEEANRIPMDKTMTPSSLSEAMKIIEEEKRKPFKEIWKEHIVELEMYRKDGSTLWTEASVRPFFDSTGKLAGLQGSTRNITERKKAEEERLEMERKMLHVQKLESLGVMAGGIAHDFNNILMAIMGHTELAIEDLPPMSPALEKLEQVRKASQHAAELCCQMLAYSGRGKFIIDIFQLDKVINEMIHLLRASISKKIHLKLDLEENLPPVEGDATQLRQIIMNLITNASEAIGDRNGLITISTGSMNISKYSSEISQEGELSDGLYVYLEVTDNGCGMDRETLKRMYEPFFTTKFTGRGLGMAAVMGIVKGHRGTIKICSEAGKGTVVKVLLPAVKESLEKRESVCSDTDKNTDIKIPAAKEALEKRKKEESGKEWKHGGWVLLVDDEQDILKLGKIILEKSGFSVITASDGQEALRLHAEHRDKIDIIILDLTMPHMGGEETFYKLRSTDRSVPIIMASGYTEHEINKRFAGKGLTGFIQKPYSLQNLRYTICEIMEKTSEIKKIL